MFPAVRSHSLPTGACPAGKSELLETPWPMSAAARHSSDLSLGFGPWVFILFPRKLWKASPGTQELLRNRLLSHVGGTARSTDTLSLLGLAFKCPPDPPGAKLGVNAASHRSLTAQCTTSQAHCCIQGITWGLREEGRRKSLPEQKSTFLTPFLQGEGPREAR